MQLRPKHSFQNPQFTISADIGCTFYPAISTIIRFKVQLL